MTGYDVAQGILHCLPEEDTNNDFHLPIKGTPTELQRSRDETTSHGFPSFRFASLSLYLGTISQRAGASYHLVSTGRKERTARW